LTGVPSTTAEAQLASAAVSPIVTPAPTDTLDVERQALRRAESAQAFARVPLKSKVEALAEVRARLHRRGHELARLGVRAKGMAGRAGSFAEELLAGAVIIQRYVRLLYESLQQIRERGVPFIADDRVRRLPSGEVGVQVMPHSLADRLLFMPYEIEVRLAASVDAGRLASAQASFYRGSADGSVAAVLGGGNVASIPALDVLHQCFVEGRACVLKMSPVNAYLGPHFEWIFEPIARLGGLSIVYGGADVGKALLASPYVDHVHLTGAIETHDAIVWGPPGAEQSERRRQGHPLLHKSVTSELGNVSPVVIAPGPYTERELSDVAESVAGMLFNNASFNCNAAKLLIVPQELAGALTQRLQNLFAAQPSRPAYYPGARERFRQLTQSADPGSLWSAPAAEGELPWTLLKGLAPEQEARVFSLEPFCPLLSVVELDEREPQAFLARAVELLNERVWGTLNAMLVMPSALEGEPTIEAALSKAIAELRYGTVAVNYWPAIGYGTGCPPWGGHPSSTLQDAQSGIGFVHNALMLEHVQKVVLRGPLRSFPKQFYYPSFRHLEQTARGLFEYESTGSARSLVGTAYYGARG
jgi:aldehyde dehydrogenase (NAD(P)+)